MDDAQFSDAFGSDQPNGLEPELGGHLRDQGVRSGFEPELGGSLRQQAVYVDELTCIGCKHCAHVARNTFYIEPDYGRSRAYRQDGDSEELIQEAIDTCPVNCIHWVTYAELKQLEEDRKYQVIPTTGFPVDKAVAMSRFRRAKFRAQSQSVDEGP
ncbi:Ferredoxin (Bacterial type ferredoxin family) [Halomicronema hongdechloris C2206]|uniref:Ferredoxin (Bacterial type ferredoxin family) n=1 Tax=Halomicronema hongdechloris C2206 TaxID=1641165 RepID=A0A1Z3HVC4_9CYAN|nr:ferredoxin [Halomicronema hongdechloris]ASC74243.1 Ferredoxin (Bacterial type ferredoxin family) [Halomicronema hongdechloris C2206]